MQRKFAVCFFAGLCALAHTGAAQVERIWLTHQSPDPSRMVVNWETAQPGNSVVEFGTTPKLDRTVSRAENVTLHHVEIPITGNHGLWHYRVRSGTQSSQMASFKGYPTDALRVAVVGDWGYAEPDLTALRRDDPHLLLTVGDNVPSLHQYCRSDAMHCTKAFSALIDRAPELFRSTPFLPVLGNHDKEIRPRGLKPPPEPVYDTNATAYRMFFELPGDEWKWTFDAPVFDVRFVALDLNHISDLSTTWQTCHALAPGSEQFEWYRNVMENTPAGFVLTLMNERNATMRSQAGGQWGRLFQRGSAVVTGFGYFAERAEVDGFPYFNTSLKGTGDRYPDPKSKFLASGDSYLLLTFRVGAAEMTAEIKSLRGDVLDRRTIPRRIRQ